MSVNLTVLQIVGWNTIRDWSEIQLDRKSVQDANVAFPLEMEKGDRNLIKTRSASFAWSELALIHNCVGSEAGAAFEES